MASDFVTPDRRDRFAPGGRNERQQSPIEARRQRQAEYRAQMRENDHLILDRLMGRLHELPRREREAVVAGASFMEEADQLREAILHVIADSPGTPETVKGYLRRALNGE